MADISAQHYGINIGQALRDLPLEAPMHSAWPMLFGADSEKEIPALFSCGTRCRVLLLAIIPLGLHSPPDSGVQTTGNLQTLMQQSSQLENIIVATRNSTASSASAEVISLALEDRIHAIDSQLASGSLGVSQQLNLWQQRVDILQEATRLYSSQRYRQAEGQPL